MAAKKLTDEDCKRIVELVNQGHQIKDLAKMYGVHRSCISRRCKAMYKSKKTPIDVKNKVIKAIKEGHTKAEAAEMYGLNIGTVIMFTKHLQGHSRQGNHIIRQNGINLLKRLIEEGCLISDFFVGTVRNLQKHFPTLRSARFKEKTIFYLEGREQDTIRAYFRDLPDRVVNHSALKELSFLLGYPISKESRKNLFERYRGQHKAYWYSRRLRETKLEDWFREEDLGRMSWEYYRYLEPGE